LFTEIMFCTTTLYSKTVPAFYFNNIENAKFPGDLGLQLQGRNTIGVITRELPPPASKIALSRIPGFNFYLLFADF